MTNGRLGALALHGASALTGGIPLRVDGEVVGAIGTSGETPDEDEAISIAGAAAEFSVSEVAALTYEGARLAAEAAGAAAAERGVSPVISAVDAGGALMYLVRPDTAQVASVEVTTDKARTAAIYRRPSKDFEVRRPAGGRPRSTSPRGAAPGRRADRILRRGDRGDRRERRDRRRRGPRARRAGRAVAPGGDRGPRERRRLGRRGVLPRCRGGREVPRRRPAARHRYVQDRRGPPRGPRRGRVPRARRGRHARGEGARRC